MKPVDLSDLGFEYDMRAEMGSEYELLDQWHVRLTRRRVHPDGESVTEVLAQASFILIDGHRFRLYNSVLSYAEYYSQDLWEAVDVVVDEAGMPRRRVAEMTDDWPIAFLVMEQVTVARPYRGQQLGLILAAEAISTLGRGCDLVVTYPAPTERPEKYGTPEHIAQCKALRRYWRRIGFRALDKGFSALPLNRWSDELGSYLLRTELSELVEV